MDLTRYEFVRKNRKTGRNDNTRSAIALEEFRANALLVTCWGETFLDCCGVSYTEGFNCGNSAPS